MERRGLGWKSTGGIEKYVEWPAVRLWCEARSSAGLNGRSGGFGPPSTMVGLCAARRLDCAPVRARVSSFFYDLSFDGGQPPAPARPSNLHDAASCHPACPGSALSSCREPRTDASSIKSDTSIGSSTPGNARVRLYDFCRRPGGKV